MRQRRPGPAIQRRPATRGPLPGPPASQPRNRPISRRTRLLSCSRRHRDRLIPGHCLTIDAGRREVADTAVTLVHRACRTPPRRHLHPVSEVIQRRRPGRGVPGHRVAPVGAGLHRDVAPGARLVVAASRAPAQPGPRAGVAGAVVVDGPTPANPCRPLPARGPTEGRGPGCTLGRGSPHGVSADAPTRAARRPDRSPTGRAIRRRWRSGTSTPPPRSTPAQRDRRADRTGPALRVCP